MLPKLDGSSGWEVLIETQYDQGLPPERMRLQPGELYPLQGRSVALLAQLHP
jgi:hypothetical protein